MLLKLLLRRLLWLLKDYIVPVDREFSRRNTAPPMMVIMITMMRHCICAMVVMMVVYLTALLLEADPSRLHHVVLAFTFILIVAGGHKEEL